MKQPGQNAFTLVEMMAVILIMGIMLSIGIVALRGSVKGNAVAAGARQVYTTLGLTRQYAITRRQNVRLVFPINSTGGVATTMAYRAYGIIANTNPPSATPGWTYLGRWETIPDGAVFADSGSDGSSIEALPVDNNLPYPTNGAAVSTLSYIEFSSLGAWTGASGTGTITVMEGYTSGGSPTVTSAKNKAYVSFDSILGRIALTRP